MFPVFLLLDHSAPLQKLLRALMEDAFEHFKEIIYSSFNKETSSLKQEIIKLKGQVNNLTKLLKEKDEQCRHIAAVLHTKNAEWKRIKLKLAENKKQKSYNFDDVEVIIEREAREDEENKDRNEGRNYNRDISQNNLNTTFDDTNNDFTQLPPPHPSQSKSLETQSNLEALIDLISEEEEEKYGDDTANYIEPLPTSRSNSFTIESSKIQKRKSHARGCSCCDKFYSATRSPSSNPQSTSISADSFLVSPNTPPGFWDTSFTPRQ